jgi:hypothetical protein
LVGNFSLRGIARDLDLTFAGEDFPLRYVTQCRCTPDVFAKRRYSARDGRVMDAYSNGSEFDAIANNGSRQDSRGSLDPGLLLSGINRGSIPGRSGIILRFSSKND